MIAELVSLIHAYGGLAFYYDDGKMMGIVPMLVEAGVDVVETCTPPPSATSTSSGWCASGGLGSRSSATPT
jgi:hypothetical protein